MMMSYTCVSFVSFFLKRIATLDRGMSKKAIVESMIMARSQQQSVVDDIISFACFCCLFLPCRLMHVYMYQFLSIPFAKTLPGWGHIYNFKNKNASDSVSLGIYFHFPRDFLITHQPFFIIIIASNVKIKLYITMISYMISYIKF